MAGTISLSLSQQFNSLGKPLSGGKLYFYKAGTVAQPQSAFKDSALTIEHPNPITLDAAGRIPQFYLADGQIKIVLRDADGVTQINADNLLVIGASSGSGTAPSVDDTTIFDTGDLKFRYDTGSLSGWVRANGRTIGSGTSGASERANSDTEDLFLHLWGTDENLTVSGGRGSTAAADWAANKSIALPDLRGRVPAGLDDMGSSDASRLTSTYFGTDATVLGAVGGSEKHTLTQAQLAAHTHTATVTDPGHTHTYTRLSGGSQTAAGPQAPGGNATNDTTGSRKTGITVSNASVGSGSAHNNTQPTMVVTYYLKL